MKELEYWSNGVIEYWNTGVLECWSTGVLKLIISIGCVAFLDDQMVDPISLFSFFLKAFH